MIKANNQSKPRKQIPQINRKSKLKIKHVIDSLKNIKKQIIKNPLKKVNKTCKSDKKTKGRVMIDIGKALKEHRKAAELSQSELAAKTNIKQQNISRWENGTHIPNVADCIVLADFFGISIDYLVGYENEDGSKNPIN